MTPTQKKLKENELARLLKTNAFWSNFITENEAKIQALETELAEEA